MLINLTQYFVLLFDVAPGVAEETALVAMATVLLNMTSETWTTEGMDRTRLKQNLVTRTVLRTSDRVAVMIALADQKISPLAILLTVEQGFNTGGCRAPTQSDQERFSLGVPALKLSPNPSPKSSKLNNRDSD